MSFSSAPELPETAESEFWRRRLSWEQLKHSNIIVSFINDTSLETRETIWLWLLEQGCRKRQRSTTFLERARNGHCFKGNIGQTSQMGSVHWWAFPSAHISSWTELSTLRQRTLDYSTSVQLKISSSPCSPTMSRNLHLQCLQSYQWALSDRRQVLLAVWGKNCHLASPMYSTLLFYSRINYNNNNNR